MPTTKEQISQTARSLFLEDGVDGISMRKIADEVGVSATAIYRHYRNKDELLDAITDAGFAIFNTYLERASTELDPAARLRAMIVHYLDFALEHPKDYDFMFIIRRRNVRQYSDDLARRTSSSFNLLADVVEELMHQGRLVLTNPADLALTIWAHIHGLVSLYRAGRFERESAEFRRLYEASFRHLLAGIET